MLTYLNYLSGSTLSVCLPQDFEENEEYRFNLKSLTDGREVSSQIARKRGVLFENINPGENYRIFASKEIKDGMSKVIASAQIQTCKNKFFKTFSETTIQNKTL